MLSKPMLWSVLNESASSSTSADLVGFVRHWVFIMCFFFYYFYNTLYNRYILKIKAHLLYSNAIYTTYFHRCFHVIFKHKIQTIENYILYFDFVIIWFFFSNERLLLMSFIDSLIIYASVWFKWIRIEYEEIFWI